MHCEVVPFMGTINRFSNFLTKHEKMFDRLWTYACMGAFCRDLEVCHGLCRDKIKINLTESHRHDKVLAVRNLYRNSIVALRYIKFLMLLTWAFQSHFSEGNPFVLCCVSFTRVLWPTLGGKIYKEVKSFDQQILVTIFMYW